jgi:hypothetical protein
MNDGGECHEAEWTSGLGGEFGIWSRGSFCLGVRRASLGLIKLLVRSGSEIPRSAKLVQNAIEKLTLEPNKAKALAQGYEVVSRLSSTRRRPVSSSRIAAAMSSEQDAISAVADSKPKHLRTRLARSKRSTKSSSLETITQCSCRAEPQIAGSSASRRPRSRTALDQEDCQRRGQSGIHQNPHFSTLR